MDAVKKVKITKHYFGILGYEVKMSPGGYQIIYDSNVVSQWTNPGSFIPKNDGSSGMEIWYEQIAWEEVKRHYQENSSIATLTVGDKFEVWDNKAFRVESIEGEMLHCVMIKPVAPVGASVTRKFTVGDLIVAVDLELQEVASERPSSE